MAGYQARPDIFKIKLLNKEVKEAENCGVLATDEL